MFSKTRKGLTERMMIVAGSLILVAILLVVAYKIYVLGLGPLSDIVGILADAIACFANMPTKPIECVKTLWNAITLWFDSIF